jgi:NADPH:quinone reductase-like Zn-dependent oxidoreductase
MSLSRKVPEGVPIEAAASVIVNMATAVGALTVRGGLGRASFSPVPAKGKKVLIYGGSSSVGALAIQYAASAGYTVISTSSPRNHAFVSTLGAAKIVDHTLSHEEIVTSLKAEGPYELAFDAISLAPTIPVVAEVVAAQGGGKIYVVLPPMDPASLPKTVEPIMDSYAAVLEKPGNEELRKWFYETYLPEGLASGKIVPSRLEKVKGGLEGINDALDRLAKGVSGVKLIVDPFEE